MLCALSQCGRHSRRLRAKKRGCGETGEGRNRKRRDDFFKDHSVPGLALIPGFHFHITVQAAACLANLFFQFNVGMYVRNKTIMLMGIHLT